MIPVVFLLSAAALADEIFLIRLLSVRFWPHFVPLIVSQAMLGFGAAGMALQLLRLRVRKDPCRVFAWLILLAGPSFDLAFRISQQVPFDPFLLLWQASAWPAFGLFFAVLSVPFFLVGAAIAVPFAFRFGKPGPVYAASFAGSAAGAILALPVLSLVPTEALLRVPLGLALAAGIIALRFPDGRISPGRVSAVAASVLLLLLPQPILKLSPYKDLAIGRKLPGATPLATRFGPSGEYRALFAPGIHSAPGMSFRFDGVLPPQAAIYSDGEIRGFVPRIGGQTPPAYLGYFPSSLAYRLVDRPAVLQFGLRGTEGILTAAGNGASSVTVVEPAAELVDLVEKDLGEFTGLGAVPLRPEIRKEGARNFLARDTRRFDLVEMSDISSLTFSSLGIHATGETFLLTREGIMSVLSRLSERGFLVFSGWLKSPPRESVKILKTLRMDLEESGGRPAGQRIAMVRGWGTFAILVKHIPFSKTELDQASRFCAEMGFSMVWPLHGKAAGGGSAEEKALEEAVTRALTGPFPERQGELFDLYPVTDDSPYFHRFLRLSSLPQFRRLLGAQWVPFVEWGMLFLMLSLAVSLALAGICLLLPLTLARPEGTRVGMPLVAYFSALGLGYMLIELTFLKLGILILGDAIRAATASIGGFAFFSGLGSATSGRWERIGTMKNRVFPGIAFLALSGFLVLSFLAPHLLTRGEGWRIVMFLGALSPAAFLMGMPFPAALARLSEGGTSAIPFAWGVNGFFSVAGASLASVGALWIGFRGTALVGSALYLAASALYSQIGRPVES